MWASSIFFVLLKLSSALEFTNEPPPHITLPRKTPIYLGEVTDTNGSFRTIAWLPTSKICTMSSAFTESEIFAVGEEDPIAPRIDDLVVTGYRSPRARITRSGKAFAACHVTPNSIIATTCSDGEYVWRTLTCFVDESDEAQERFEEEKRVKYATIPDNVAEPPPEFEGQEGTYQRWFCDEKGCHSSEK